MKQVLVIGVFSAVFSVGAGEARLSARNAEVAVAPDAPAATRFAAGVLTEHLSKVLGGEIMCVTAPTEGKFTIFLGTNGWSRAEGLRPETLRRDSFCIRVAADRAFVVGCDDPKTDPEKVIASRAGTPVLFERATLFGVYDFLERFAGCRFYFPGELGTVVPRKDELRLVVGDVTISPQMQKRDCYLMGAGPYPGVDPKDAAAQSRAKTAYTLFLRETTEDIRCCHGQNRFNIAERFSESHPEYFQLRKDGTRCTGTKFSSNWMGRQLCHTSPVWDVFRDESVERVRKGEKVVDIMPQDGMTPCMCEACQRTFNTDDFSLSSGYATELIWSNTVKVAEAITAAGLKGGVSQMAYGTYRNIPSVDIPSNVKVVLAVGGPWALSHPDICEKQYDFVRTWSEKLKGKVAWIWTYPMKNYGRLQAKGVPQVAPRAYAAFYNRVLPWIDGSFVESNVGETLVQNYLNFYVFSRIAWYGKTDVEALLEEHHRLMFGPGASAMAKFFDKIEDKWIHEIAVPSLIGETEIGPTLYPPTEAELWSKVCTPTYVAELDGLLKSAAAATSPGSLESRRVAWIRSELFDRLAAGSTEYQKRIADVAKFVVKVGRDADGAFVIDRKVGRRGEAKAQASVSARAKMWKTATTLEVVVDCDEPDMANVVARERKHDDPETWMDNGVEFFISPDMSRSRQFQIVVTSAGALFDRENARGQKSLGTKWDSHATAQVTKREDGYRIELSVPLASLPGLGGRALVNFGRDRVRKEGTEFIIADTPANSYQDVENYATVDFGDEVTLFPHLRIPPEWRERLVSIRSSLDGSDQPAYFVAPKKGGKAPLFVGLHTWSYDLTNLAHYPDELKWCQAHGWAFIAPNFRGPNSTPAGCGSDLAVQDIVDAVAWAKAHADVDPDRVYIMGGSGGGHMTLLMAGRHPELWAGCCAFCPISDVAAWHRESRELGMGYDRQLEKACGGTPSERPDEYARRSPLTHLAAAKGVPVMIGTGVHDGHKRKGSVPVSQAIRAYNLLAKPEDRVAAADIETIVRTESVPDAIAFTGEAPFYPPQRRVHLRKTSGNVQLTLFEGGHSCNFAAGFDFLSRQVRGKPADWTLPANGTSMIKQLTK